MRVWVTFSDEEYEHIKEKAQEQGMTPQKYISNCALLQVGLPVEETKLTEIYAQIDRYLKKRKKGDSFICSATVDDWQRLSRSDKMCVSKYISKVVQNNPGQYEIIRDGRDGHAKVYKVL